MPRRQDLVGRALRLGTRRRGSRAWAHPGRLRARRPHAPRGAGAVRRANLRARCQGRQRHTAAHPRPARARAGRTRFGARSAHGRRAHARRPDGRSHRMRRVQHDAARRGGLPGGLGGRQSGRVSHGLSQARREPMARHRRPSRPRHGRLSRMERRQAFPAAAPRDGRDRRTRRRPVDVDRIACHQRRDSPRGLRDSGAPGTAPITLDEVRRAGPLAGTASR